MINDEQEVDGQNFNHTILSRLKNISDLTGTEAKAALDHSTASVNLLIIVSTNAEKSSK